jgi:CarD family transcriptional regulator
MFSLHQKVVYPGHGVAQINRIFEKKIGNNVSVLLELKFLHKDMTVMVPMDKANEVGIRPLASGDSINKILSNCLQSPKKIDIHELSASNWNRRNKDYQNKLRTGSLEAISSIYSDLKAIACQKELSFGEKTLLQKTETLLVEEISASNNMEEEKAIEQLRSFFIAPLKGMYQKTI